MENVKGNIYFKDTSGEYCRIFKFMNLVFDKTSIADLIKLKNLEEQRESILSEINNTNIPDILILDQYHYGDNHLDIVEKHHKLGNLKTITKAEIISLVDKRIENINKLKELICIDESVEMLYERGFELDDITEITIDFQITQITLNDAFVCFDENEDKIFIYAESEYPSVRFSFDHIKKGYKIKLSFNRPYIDNVLKEYLRIEFIEN